MFNIYYHQRNYNFVGSITYQPLHQYIIYYDNKY